MACGLLGHSREAGCTWLTDPHYHPRTAKANPASAEGAAVESLGRKPQERVNERGGEPRRGDQVGSRESDFSRAASFRVAITFREW